MPRKPPSKRGLTLDLNAPPAPKKTRANQSSASSVPVLTTPDVQMLKLSSPELAKFLTSNHTLPSGSTLPTPTAGSGGYVFPKTVTEEQELYAKGFEDALNNLKNKEGVTTKGAQQAPIKVVSKGSAPAPTATATAIDTIERATSAHSSRAAAAAAAGTGGQIPVAVADLPAAAVAAASTSSAPEPVTSRPPSVASSTTSLDSSSETNSVKVKEEYLDDDEDDDDEDVPLTSGRGTRSGAKAKGKGSSSKAANGASSVSPIDMASQEKIKLERKRLRNRVAASKCRKRKLERISQLDDRVSALKGENAELAAVVKKLKAAVCDLKQEVMQHVNSGCEILIGEDSFS